MNKRRTIILNGPPRSGKDTISSIISREYGYNQISFKEELINHTCYYFGCSLEWFMDKYEEEKEIPKDELMGMSRRQALIYVSEYILKPRNGKGIFGENAVQSMISSGKDKFVFSDGGFVEEFLEVKKYDPNLAVIKIFRPDHDFTNDSRSYLPDNICERVYHIHNDGTIDKARSRLSVIIKNYEASIE